MYRSFFKRPAFTLLIPYLSGLILGQFFEISRQFLLLLILGLISTLILLWKLRFSAFLLFISLFLFFLIGVLFIETSLHPRVSAHDVKTLVDEKRWDIEGILYRAPEVLRERSKLYVDVEKAFTDHVAKKVTGRMVLTVGDTGTDLNYGDRIRFNTKITVPRNYGNPGGFDYERFMVSRGVAVKGFVKNHRWIARLSSQDGNRFWKKLEKTRDHLRQFLDAWVPEPARGILKALLLGEKGEIPRNVRETFIRTGTAHILAISGLHIGIIAFASFWIIRKILSLSEHLLLAINIRKLAALFTFIPVILYSLIGGFSVPTQRAMIMVLVFLLAILLDRERDLYNTLSLAALIILLVHPLSLFDVSFQLSFAAVISIVYIAPKINAVREREIERILLPRNKIKEWAVTLVLISFAASLGTSPVAAFHFHRISFLGLLSNLFAVPLVGFVVVPLTLMAGLLSFFSFSAAVPLIHLSTFILDVTYKILSLMSEVPYASIWVTTPTLFGISLYYLGVISLMEVRNRKSAPYILIAIVSIFIIYKGSSYVLYKIDNRLCITFISVGQGDSTLIEFPHGRNMLIDGGGVRGEEFDIGENVVAPFLWEKGIKRIDYLVSTHPQADHMKGLIFIAKNFRVREFWWNGEESDLAEFNTLMKVIREQDIQNTVKNSRSTPVNINGVDVAVIHPPEVENTLDTNDNSLVLRVTYGTVSLLLPGDLEKNGEAVLVSSQQNLKSTVVKAPHHGSTTSSTERFIDKVGPDIAVFSVGYKNRFGFPHKEIIDRYLKRGVKIFRTDEEGAITMITDGEAVTTHTFR